MTGAEVQAAYFSPMNFALYLLVILVIIFLVYQITWSNKVTRFVKVLVVKPDGSTETSYSPKDRGYVALTNPETNVTKMWPINQLCAIEEYYPGDGFFPKPFLKKIKTVIVSEDDWEPMLNRGAYAKMVASPDVKQILLDMAESYPDAAEDLLQLSESLSSASTRELIASPEVLGNLMHEKTTEMAIAIGKETFDRLDNITKKLNNLPNAMIMYIGIGAVVILMIVVLAKVLPVIEGLDLTKITASLDAIKIALRIG